MTQLAQQGGHFMEQASGNVSVIRTLAGKLQVDPAKLAACLKNTAFKGAGDDEFMSLCVVANAYNLNPFTKEIYAFPAKGGGIVPIVSIDGWLRIINEHPKFDGLDVQMAEDGEECTVAIYRNDRTRPTIVTEYLSECRRNTDPWRTAPKRMLRHKAIIQCARVAFGFGGIHEQDEAETFAEMRNVTPAQVVEPELPAPVATKRKRAAKEAAPAPAPAPEVIEAEPVDVQESAPWQGEHLGLDEPTPETPNFGEIYD